MTTLSQEDVEWSSSCLMLIFPTWSAGTDDDDDDDSEGGVLAGTCCSSHFTVTSSNMAADEPSSLSVDVRRRPCSVTRPATVTRDQIPACIPH